MKQDFVLDTAKIRAELDYRELVDRDTAIGTAVPWLLSQPPSTDDPAAHLQQSYEVEDAFLRR